MGKRVPPTPVFPPDPAADADERNDGEQDQQQPLHAVFRTFPGWTALCSPSVCPRYAFLADKPINRPTVVHSGLVGTTTPRRLTSAMIIVLWSCALRVGSGERVRPHPIWPERAPPSGVWRP